MSGFLLDTSALLALRDDEPGAERVADILKSASRGAAVCHGCFISLMEVLYRVWKDEGEEAGRNAYRVCQRLPMTWLHESAPLLERAAEIKVRFPLSLADAWIAAAALELDVVLVHKDPEFKNVSGLQQEFLPCK
jgi:predicted nucleic acid-binding protein